MADSESFDRRIGIGSSEAAAVLGWSKFTSPLEVYNAKISEEPQDYAPSPDNSWLYWGQRLESLLIEEYELRTKRVVNVAPGRFVRKHHNGLLVWATPDGVAYDVVERPNEPPDYDVPVAVVNAKTSRSDTDWGEPGTGEIPLYYMAQAVVEMACTELPQWHCPVLFAGQRFEVYVVERDMETERDLLNDLASWWQRHVIKRVPPEPVTEKDLKITFPENLGGTRLATQDEIDHILSLRDINAKLKELDEVKKLHEIAVKRSIGEREALVNSDGDILATWKSQTREAYAVPSATFRVLRIK